MSDEICRCEWSRGPHHGRRFGELFPSFAEESFNGFDDKNEFREGIHESKSTSSTLTSLLYHPLPSLFLAAFFFTLIHLVFTSTLISFFRLMTLSRLYYIILHYITHILYLCYIYIKLRPDYDTLHCVTQDQAMAKYLTSSPEARTLLAESDTKDVVR